MNRLCTLFDSTFMPQGLSLIESISRHSEVQVEWTILALDNTSYDFMQSLNRENFQVIHIDSFPDEELRLSRLNRSWREFCWTSAACLLNYCLNLEENSEFVAYIDADCFFFGDIAKMFASLGQNHNIGIHEHRFSQDRSEWLFKSGRFNVGVICGRKSEEFYSCVSRWRSQVIERCDVNQTEGRCGDQTYLNEWPDLYSGLYIFSQLGVGLAPWNVSGAKLVMKENQVFVGDDPLYFYHFHGLEIGKSNSFLTLFVSAAGYEGIKGTYRLIYAPYLASISQMSALSGQSASRKRGIRWYLSHLLRRTLFLKLNR